VNQQLISNPHFIIAKLSIISLKSSHLPIINGYYPY